MRGVSRDLVKQRADDLQKSELVLLRSSSSSIEGYRLQFRVRPPGFSGVVRTVLRPDQGLVLGQEVRSLLEKGAVELVPPQAGGSGLYSRYFLVPKKDGGLRPILDLRVLNWSLRRYRFKMLTIPAIGIRILNYIDDWLILAQSRELAVRHQDVVLAHLLRLGLRLNEGKSVLASAQRTVFLGLVWDSLTMLACLSLARFESVLATVKSVRLGSAITVKHFQRVFGLMAAASSLIPSGLLHMRALQWWLKSKGFSPRGNPFRLIRVAHKCLRALSVWKEPWFLSQGPALGAPCRRVIVLTDASLTGWGAVNRSARGVWQEHHSSWHIYCLKMLSVFGALRSFLPAILGHHVLVRFDNTAVVAYLNHQGGLRSCPLCRLAHRILLWSQRRLLSLRAMFIPGLQNQGVDLLSRQGLRPGEWRLHPEVVESLCVRFGPIDVDLFASRETTHCPLWFSLTPPAPLGLDAMVREWPRLRLYAFPPVALLPGILERVRREGICLLLVAPFWPTRVWFSDLMALLDGPPWREEGPAVPGRRPGSSPLPRPVAAVGLALEGAQYLEAGLTAGAVDTLLSSRALSTRRMYGLKWDVFSAWCRGRMLDLVTCPVVQVLEFLQERFSAGLSPSTLKVYVAAISAFHSPSRDGSLGRLPLVVRFLCGTRRMRPATRPRIPTWDLAVVLEALAEAPFEPMESAEAKYQTLKMAFLLAITSLRRVGDLQALSVAPRCMEFAPGNVRAILHPIPGYIHKVQSSVTGPVVLQAFHPPPHVFP
ncbi:uncharacterized protein LOC117958235 [Etheostoma cragini]|uniref:uncharacterized protein LOC117958235 n=1 Tax=Etheostoma cragini TaxID=417921 RepID=UPI00155DE4EA|nr:uncharacterized protein LOC117958235 [Etheostoma cragini]